MSETTQSKALCATCGDRFITTVKRKDICKPCYERAYARAYRLRQYHMRIKPDPKLLAKHRKQSKEAGARYRARKQQAKTRGTDAL